MKKLVFNIKLNFVKSEMEAYADYFATIIPLNSEIVMCPSIPFLYLFNEKSYYLGAQNVSEFNQGAYTGEVSAKQLKSMSVKYIIIGHSERMKVSIEDNDKLTSKIINALDNDMIPVLCIGETAKERKIKKTDFLIKEKLNKIFSKINPGQLSKIIIAYEPIWAIGSGEVPTKDEINRICNLIKSFVFDRFKTKVEVLYGGSVNAMNITSLSTIESCDGFLVGNASLNLKEVEDIINICK